MTSAGEETGAPVDRRALLRRAGIVALGGAGVAAVGAAWAPTAEAAAPASKLLPVRPTRVVDTRTDAGRSNIVNRSGNLDSLGRLLAGHTIEIDLSHFVFDATAVLGNLTAVAPLLAGYLALWPEGARPGTSSVNFLPSVTTANFALSGLSTADTVLLYAHATTHVLLDVTAFAVTDQAKVNPAVRWSVEPREPGAVTARKAPAWYHGAR